MDSVCQIVSKMLNDSFYCKEYIYFLYVYYFREIIVCK